MRGLRAGEGSLGRLLKEASEGQSRFLWLFLFLEKGGYLSRRPVCWAYLSVVRMGRSV